ncbi:MAG TPA: GNAT family N-acetyltransferase [Streptosporangiaceae bacterium]|nr:GNAT family N-acetyltransferase [Streptosporangiaceae bacterium]
MTDPRGTVRIRLYEPGDRDDLYQVCLLTADNGHDATDRVSDPRLPGDVWLGPYLTFEPSLAFVAQDAGGPGGYVVAALDSHQFEERLERDWWPARRLDYPEPAADVAAALAPTTRHALHDMHHPWATPANLTSRYPSHLHIDLVPRLQGHGIGGRLIDTLLSQLREQGSRGVHLMVGRDNKRAVGFYQHLGFAEYPAASLGPDFPASQLRVFTMKLTA